MLGPNFAGLLVVIFWDQISASYTKLQFILGPEFNDCEGNVTDTFELLRASPDLQTKDDPAYTFNVTCFHRTISRWISQCATQHANSCGALESSSSLPTRLIDIDDHKSSPPTPRLVLTKDLQSHGCRYIALSYLPQVNEFDGLCTSTIEDFQTHLPVESFPPLLRYAILVTRALGCRYIWVDTLCILQDCPDDQSRKLPIIGKVYQCCVLNVTAESVNRIARAFQPTCNVNLMAPYRLKLSYGHKSPRLLVPYDAVPENIWSVEMVESQIACYGGYFQDQLMASRKLHSGSRQVYWECAGLRACETFPSGLPPPMLQDSANEATMQRIYPARSQPKVKSYNFQPPSGVNVQEKLTETWRRLVNEYSACGLSVPRTRLNGISGVARELEALGNQKYVAGIWQDSLVDDLVWYVDGAPSRRPNVYCAPSWSWASVEGAVTHIPTSQLSRNCVRVIRVHTALLDLNISTGQVGGGFILLHGYLVRIPKPKFFYVRGSLCAGCFYPDDRGDITDYYYFCLPLRLQRSARGDFLCGLVLRQIVRPWALTYQRVGMFRCLRGDSLHMLGQKKYGKDTHVSPADPTRESI